MSSAKKIIISICRPICRLISCALWQLPWFGIIGGGIWWFKRTLPASIHQHFGVDEASLNLTMATDYVRELKRVTSFTNPASLVSYISALFERTSASAKYTSLFLIANTAESIIIWLLNIAFTLTCIYAFYRIYKAFKSSTQTYSLTKNIVNQINPNIESLQSQIAILQQEILELKNEISQRK